MRPRAESEMKTYTCLPTNLKELIDYDLYSALLPSLQDPDIVRNLHNIEVSEGFLQG